MTVKQGSGSFSERHQQFVIIIAAFVSAMGIIDATALNVALPFIQSSLNAPTADVHWVLEIYLLFLAALMMAGAHLVTHLDADDHCAGELWHLHCHLLVVRWLTQQKL